MEAFAAVLLFVDLFVTDFGEFASSAIDVFALLVGAVAHTEIALSVERVRRRVTEVAHISLSSVWRSRRRCSSRRSWRPGYVIVLLTYLYFRVWRPAKVPPYREVFSTATVVLAVHAAAATVAYLPAVESDGLFGGPLGLTAVVLAVLAYTVVNTCLVVGAVVLSSDRSVRQVLGDGDEVVLELATLSLGGLVAAAVATSGPLLVVFVLPALVVLHRAVMVRQLERAANTDSKTGLLTAAAWQRMVMRRLERRGGVSAALLILDLDHFKRVNDRHGHLAGDQVLAAVGAALRDETREQDLVGRFGGEEFVMLFVRGAGEPYTYAELRGIGERVRCRIAQLGIALPTPDGPLTVNGLSASIGGALFPADGGDVHELIAVADTALFAAKRAGRNVVRLGLHRAGAAPAEAAPVPSDSPQAAG
ncbi:hypothetical protein BJF78_12565 [Pseudonocardia sp. CNS-139]|nr:hypothetical protein BJF78_12565 [Pseudonocardia sp. CNS-139]